MAAEEKRVLKRFWKIGLGWACLSGLAACGGHTLCIGTGTLNCPDSGSSSSSSSGGGSSSSSSSGAGNGFSGFVNPSTIQFGATTVVGVQITNSLATDETGVSTSITFSSGLSINAGPSYSCTPGTVATTMPNSTTTEITLSNATVPAATNCTLSATVTPPARGQFVITAAGSSLTLTVQ